MSKVASLTSGLVAKKGQAVPAVAHSEPVAELAAKERTTVAETPATYYKALTVKLDRARYEALKRAGLRADKKSQAIFVEALDAYLAQIG